MKTAYKKWTLGALASLAAGCGVLGAALFTKPVEALAADVGTPISYINVGASQALTASEYFYENAALAVDPSTAGTAGVNAEGLGVFATYRTEASVSVTVDAGEYQVAALVDANGAITVNGESASAGEKQRIISVTAEADGGSITVATAADVKLYAVMVAPVDSKILMHSEWTQQQVVVYGELLEDELTRGCPAFYSDGSVEDAVEYSSIPVGVGDGSTGANENFNSVTAKGTYTATNNPVPVERALIIMPKKLVYFLNAGSVTDHVGIYGNDSDQYYSYNKTVFDYYKSIGSPLKNDVPDADSKGSNSFGHYEDGWNGIAKKFAYPFNTGRVTNKTNFGTTNLGFRLPDVEAGEYRVYIGTASFWHGRTLRVQINGKDQPNITVPPARQVHTFDITHSGGTVDIYLIGPAADDEALANFVALQKKEDVPEEAPKDIVADSPTVGPAARELKLTGVQEGAIVQIYGSSRPYKLIYEEKAVFTEENYEGGVYSLKYDDAIADIILTEDKIRVIQRNPGGYGGTHEFAVTSIKDFKVKYTVDGVSDLTAPRFTTGDIVVTVSAKAEDGIDRIEVQKGYSGYTDIATFDPVVTYAEQDYTVTENGSYEFVFWSGKAKYANRIEINHIDNVAPTISFLPVVKAGSWSGNGNKYSIEVNVNAVSGVEKYEAVKGGVTVLSGTPDENKFVIDFDSAGEYLVTVTNKAKQSATAMLVVGNKPVYSTLEKEPSSSDVQLTFACMDNYTMQSLAVYRLVGSKAVKQSILGTDQLLVYDDTIGTYVAVIQTKQGTTEVYSIEIGEDDFVASSSTSTKKPGQTGNSYKGSGNNSYTGTIVAACIFGVAVIALVVVLLLFKKKPAMQTAQEETAPSVEEEAPVITEAKEEPKKEEAQSEEKAADPEEGDKEDESPEEDNEG